MMIQVSSLLGVLLLLLEGVHSFSPIGIVKSSPQVFSRSKVVLEAEKLVFVGDYVGLSEPLPTGTTKKVAADFLFQDKNFELLYGAGGTKAVSMLETTPELLELWEAEADSFGCDRKPTADDKIICVETSVGFPGMKLISTTASGIFVVTDEEGAPAEFLSFVVGEQSRPEGLPPAVWLFKKLTGFDKKEKGKFLPSQGKAKSVVAVVENEDGTFSFEVDVKLTVTVEFPSTLMKILPTTKEKMEEQGGKSILKAVSKDVDSAVQATRSAFDEVAATV